MVEGDGQDGSSIIPLAPPLPQVAATANTVFGTGHIGGVKIDLSINALFSLVKSIEAKIQVLSDRTKNTSIQFGEAANPPSGAGPTGF